MNDCIVANSDLLISWSENSCVALCCHSKAAVPRKSPVAVERALNEPQIIQIAGVGLKKLFRPGWSAGKMKEKTGSEHSYPFHNILEDRFESCR